MNNLKKILSMFLVTLMVLAMGSVGAVSVSAEDTLPTDTKIYFEVPENWANYSKIYCYIWDYVSGEKLMNWQSKKGICTLEDDGRYSYDTSKITLEDNIYYAVIMSADTGVQTYDTYLGTPCLGDTLYCDGTSYENPADSSKTTQSAFWRNQDASVYGPVMQITSIGNVMGTCLRPDQNAETIFSDFLTANLVNAQTYSRKSDQEIIDDLAAALNLSDGTVAKLIYESGVSVDWVGSSTPDETTRDEDYILNTQDYEYEVLEDGTARITRYTGKDKYIIIPSEIDGYKVSILGIAGNRKETKGVIISEGIATIDENALAYFEKLENVSIPTTVTELGMWAFIHCDSIKEIYIPESVQKLSYASLGYCDSLEKIEVAEDNPYFTSLDGVMYSKDMTVLVQYPSGKADTSFTAPETVTEIGREAFAAVMHLKDIILPDGLKAIGYAGFAHSDSIETVALGNSLEIMGKSAFDSCNNLKAITIPGTLKVVEWHAFQNCISLEKVTLCEGVTNTTAWSFSGCENLKELIFPESMENIGSFSGCDSLTEVVIPQNVKLIHNGAFFNCLNLKTVIVESTDAEFGVASVGVHAASGDEFPPIDGFTIIGYKGSTAEAYANEHNVTFMDIESEILLGDVNHDGTVNIKDATLIQKSVANIVVLSSFTKSLGDVNGDNTMNIKDATAVQKYVAKIDTGFKIGEVI